MAARMKDSGIEGIGLIPENWDETRRVKDIFTLSKGLPITKDNLLDEGLPVISYGQVHSKDNTGTFIKDLLIRYVDYRYRKDRTSQVKKGDFIFADTSEDLEGCGNCVYVDREDEIFAGYHTITFCSDNMDNRYLAYLFTTDAWRTQIRKRVYAVKVYTVSQKILKECKVILPPQREQRAIADFLDKRCAQIDDVITDLEKQISALQMLKKSTISEAVTHGVHSSAAMKNTTDKWFPIIPDAWSIKRFKYIFEHITDGSHVSPETGLDGYPYITAADVHGLGIDYDNAKKISKSDYEVLCKSGCRPHKDDILLVKDGATTGRVGYMIDDTECVVLSSVAILRTPETLSPKYYMYMMESSNVQEQIQASMAGSAMPRTIISKIINYEGLIAPVAEQNKIAEYLDRQCEKIDAITIAKRKQLEIIQNQKKSLIYEYVTGKKRVNEVEPYAN